MNKRIDYRREFTLEQLNMILEMARDRLGETAWYIHQADERLCHAAPTHRKSIRESRDFYRERLGKWAQIARVTSTILKSWPRMDG
mgnify:CR=1 FL=1